MKYILIFACIIFCSVLFLTGDDNAANGICWPQWRGPERQGYSPAKNIPDTFPDEGLKLIWKTELGKRRGGHSGNGSPIVAFNKVYVHSNADNKEVLNCLSLKDGKKLWSFPLQSKGGTGNGTPLIDAKNKKLYTMPSDGAQGKAKAPFTAVCLDPETGKVIWKTDGKSFGAEGGLACAAPLLVNDLLIITGGRKIAALNKDTGKMVWMWPEKLTPSQKAPVYRGKPGFKEWHDKLDKQAITGIKATSSPILVGPPDKPVIIQAIRRLADSGYTSSSVGLDAKTGKQIWLGPLYGSHHSPVYAEGILVTTVFDGNVNAYAQNYTAVGLKPEWNKDQFEMKEAWKIPGRIGGRYRMASPAVYGKKVFWREGHIIYCWDIASGKTIWKKDKLCKFQWALSAPVWVDNKIIFIDDTGNLTMLKDDGTKAEVILQKSVCGKTGATPAVSDTRLVIRDYDYGVYCYELKDQSAPSSK
jgi:outer membrane protein assembly factor BamB